jgi:hypothetical protein
MRRRYRPIGPLGWAYVVVTMGLLVSASVWLDRRGASAVAQVAAKHERIIVDHDPQGGWSRRYELDVRFPAVQALGAGATVALSQDRFDAMRVGDTLTVHYIPQFPILARPAGRTTASVAAELVWRLAGIPILVWIVGGGVVLWLAARISTPVILVCTVAWVAAAWPLLFHSPAPRPGPVETRAQVRGITLVTKSPSRRYSTNRRHGFEFDRRLAVPYQVVELRMAGPAGADSVLAVDAVDSGSVAGLALGAILPARLDPGDPREARLSGGTRHFIERNRYHFLIPVVGVGLLGGLAAYGFRRRRTRRAAQTTGANATSAA